MSKKRFVEFYLAAMLKAATENFVTRLTYEYLAETGEEIVHIWTETGTQHITVTGDSFMAIAYDVLGALDPPGGERETPHSPARSSLRGVSHE